MGFYSLHYVPKMLMYFLSVYCKTLLNTGTLFRQLEIIAVLWAQKNSSKTEKLTGALNLQFAFRPSKIKSLMKLSGWFTVYVIFYHLPEILFCCNKQKNQNGNLTHFCKCVILDC